MAEADLATLLTRLRRDGERQSGLAPELTPPDADAAYRVAAKVAENLGWEVGGWKIAANKPAMQQALRASEPMIGRVFKPFIHDSPATLDHAPLLWPVVEGEIVVRFAKDLPGDGAPYTEAEVAAAIASMHPAIEVAECRFMHDDAFPELTAILADGSGSGNLVIGPEIPDWRKRDFGAVDVSLSVNGTERRTGNVADAIDHPLTPATWVANRIGRDGFGLKAGDVISTGTCTGMMLAKPGDACVVDFAGLGKAEVRFV